MRNKPIKLNTIQKKEAIKIFGLGAYEANYHIRKILSAGQNLFTQTGIEITLGKAIKRRRKCIHCAKQALRGFVI